MTTSPDWATQLRKAVRVQVGRGWLVMPDCGRMRLQLRVEGLKTQSMNLPYAWEEANWVDALQHIKVIAKAYASGGVDLRGAAKLAAVVRSDHSTDWDEAADAYRQHKQRVSDRTWRAKYTPVFEAAFKALASKKAPTNGTDLCDMALAQWAPGTRQRQIMRQSLSGFLRYCVERRKFKSCWLPPSSVDGEYVNEKRIGYPLTDAQVLRLIEAMPDSKAGDRWRFALQLMAVYGLRPEDLRYLVTRNGGTELWSTYCKSKGGKKGARTAERRLYPLLVNDVDGPVDWSLLQRVHLGEELPPLGQPGKAGEAIRTFLKRQPTWQSIAAEAAAEGQELVPYSFRHRYSATGHGRGLQPKQMADAMGHSLEVHMGNYARFMTRDLASAFDVANGGTPALVSVGV
ncbi:integrase [Synechococcus sp. CB0205]|uniref:integrase n=1 Tax=Synechococcus sp. CB0205 TaxID=232363 RepID=UPI001E4F5725|nr:integrase [Synechococcus sp. CB0205]